MGVKFGHQNRLIHAIFRHNRYTERGLPKLQFCFTIFGNTDTLQRHVTWAVLPIFGRPFIKRFALRYRKVVCPVCPVCLSVTLVYCGQTVGGIKMKVGVQVGLDPGHIVLGGDWGPSSPKRGTTPNFRPMAVVAKRLHGLRCRSAWR